MSRSLQASDIWLYCGILYYNVKIGLYCGIFYYIVKIRLYCGIITQWNTNTLTSESVRADYVYIDKQWGITTMTLYTETACCSPVIQYLPLDEGYHKNIQMNEKSRSPLEYSGQW